MPKAIAKFDSWDFHLRNIILNGIHVRGVHHFYGDLSDPAVERFRRLNFDFFGCRYDTIHRVEGETPYSLINGSLHYEGHAQADIPFEQILSEEDDWGSERNWWFKAIPTLEGSYN